MEIATAKGNIAAISPQAMVPPAGVLSDAFTQSLLARLRHGVMACRMIPLEFLLDERQPTVAPIYEIHLDLRISQSKAFHTETLLTRERAGQVIERLAEQIKTLEVWRSGPEGKPAGGIEVLRAQWAGRARDTARQAVQKGAAFVRPKAAVQEGVPGYKQARQVTPMALEQALRQPFLPLKQEIALTRPLARFASKGALHFEKDWVGLRRNAAQLVLPAMGPEYAAPWRADILMPPARALRPAFDMKREPFTGGTAQREAALPLVDVQALLAANRYAPVMRATEIGRAAAGERMVPAQQGAQPIAPGETGAMQKAPRQQAPLADAGLEHRVAPRPGQGARPIAEQIQTVLRRIGLALGSIAAPQKPPDTEAPVKEGARPHTRVGSNLPQAAQAPPALVLSAGVEAGPAFPETHVAETNRHKAPAKAARGFASQAVRMERGKTVFPPGASVSPAAVQGAEQSRVPLEHPELPPPAAPWARVPPAPPQAAQPYAVRVQGVLQAQATIQPPLPVQMPLPVQTPLLVQTALPVQTQKPAQASVLPAQRSEPFAHRPIAGAVQGSGEKPRTMRIPAPMVHAMGISAAPAHTAGIPAPAAHAMPMPAAYATPMPAAHAMPTPMAHTAGVSAASARIRQLPMARVLDISPAKARAFSVPGKAFETNRAATRKQTSENRLGGKAFVPGPLEYVLPGLMAASGGAQSPAGKPPAEAKELPKWAQDFFDGKLTNAQPPLISQKMVAPTLESARQGAQGERNQDAQRGSQTVWSAPGYLPQARLAHKEKEEPQRSPALARVSDAEINRLANRVYAVLEARISREWRRMGL